MDRYIVRDSARIPTFFYGTAWKEDRTEALTCQAIAAGFTAIDTANQRKHYFEAGVGAALRERPPGSMFVQTKFTHRDGQDHRLPYDAAADIEVQVAQSCQSSREHLGVEVIDAYVLHGPSSRRGWPDLDRRAWQAMERLHARGHVRHLGISNVTAEQLERVVAASRVPLTFVQNRCYARQRWDAAVRAVCARHGILYQGFSLLTANPEVLADARVRAWARARGTSEARLVFRFCLELGIIPLTGSSSAQHLADDLAAYDDASLGAETVAELERGFGG